MLTFLFQSLALAIRPILYYTAFLMSKENCDSLLWNVGYAIIYRIVHLRDVDKHRPLRDCAGWDVGGAALSAPRADVGIRPYVICGSSKRLPYN